jgi:glycosyltransferase involved in cell wall biosynthesis
MLPNRLQRAIARMPLFYWGLVCTLIGLVVYFSAITLSMLRLLFPYQQPLLEAIHRILWVSGIPTTLGVTLICLDIALLLPKKRRFVRTDEARPVDARSLTVVLTAYNDEESITAAVDDFLNAPLVRRVIVVSNNSADRTLEFARQAGAIAVNETVPGYGSCVYRCFEEALRFEDASYIVLCEGDRTFRAADISKLVAYLPHAEIVNGTRIVEQLRQYQTQLSSFMYYGNFFAGKLLEAKHLGRGTFTDVGTTYKIIVRESLMRLLPKLDRRINLEFNAHFLDTALNNGIPIVECPITFHPRVGRSKGGNTNNSRAFKVGMRMIVGLSFGWRWLR